MAAVLINIKVKKHCESFFCSFKCLFSQLFGVSSLFPASTVLKFNFTPELKICDLVMLSPFFLLPLLPLLLWCHQTAKKPFFQVGAQERKVRGREEGEMRDIKAVGGGVTLECTVTMRKKCTLTGLLRKR